MFLCPWLFTLLPFLTSQFQIIWQTRRQWWFEFSNSLKSIFTTVANNRTDLFGRIHAADADVSKAFIMSTSILINQTEGSTPVCGSLLPPLYVKDTGKRLLSEDRYRKDKRKVSNIASTYVIYPRRNSIHIITRQTNYVSMYPWGVLAKPSWKWKSYKHYMCFL
jgi:hypothetical protein